MKTDRFAAVLLAALLASSVLAASKPPIKIEYRIGKNHEVVKVEVEEKSSTGVWTQALAKETERVQEKFDAGRKALQILHEPGEAPAYLVNDVTKLIGDTHKDLDQTIQSSKPSGSESLVAWVDDQFQQIQGKSQPPGPTASLSGPFAPRAVAVFASFRGAGRPMLAVAKPSKPTPAKPKSVSPKSKPAPKAPPPPKPPTIPVATADGFLDQVKEIVNQIFVLAKNDDLEVKLWVGSPAPKVTFSFWPQLQLNGATPAPFVIRTDGTRSVMRGLFAYKATWARAKGQVAELIQYPTPAGAPAAQISSERLDLVNGTPFFCCRFNEQYCAHVNNEKECRP